LNLKTVVALVGSQKVSVYVDIAMACNHQDDQKHTRFNSLLGATKSFGYDHELGLIHTYNTIFV